MNSDISIIDSIISTIQALWHTTQLLTVMCWITAEQWLNNLKIRKKKSSIICYNYL